MTNRILIFLNTIALVCSVIWIYFSYSLESIISTLLLIATIISLLFKNQKELKKDQEVSKSSGHVKNQITITNNVMDGGQSQNVNPKSSKYTKEELEQRKRLTNVLFIDDDIKFKIIKILNVSGWVNTKIIKDVKNPDDEIVTKSHIIFVDINDVGIKMGFTDEGLGLARYLKNKYPKKKVIIYSTDSSGNRFHPALREVDTFLPKNAEPFEFQEIIEQYSAEIEL